jgi:hypothetical protein
MLTSISQTDAVPSVPVSRSIAVRGAKRNCFEIGIGADSMVRLAEYALDNSIALETHESHELAHSVNLLAKEMRRRADNVFNFLEKEEEAQIRTDEHSLTIKTILRQRMNAWKVYKGAPEEEEELYAQAEKEFHKGDREAKEAINRLCPHGLEAAMAQMIIAKGPGINFELKLEAFAERLDAEVAAAGLEHFGLREHYDELFPGKYEEAH